MAIVIIFFGGFVAKNAIIINYCVLAFFLTFGGFTIKKGMAASCHLYLFN
jgi:hypothetical protein